MRKGLTHKQIICNYPCDILEKETMKEFGYSGINLAKYSKKYIMVRCRFCGLPHKIRRNKFEESGHIAIHLNPCRREESKLTGAFNNKDICQKANDSNRNLSDEKRKIKSERIKEKLADPTIKEQIKKTNLKKYNVENPSQNEEIKKKKQQTFLNHYQSYQNKEIWDKRIKTCKEKYNCDYVTQTKNMKLKNQEYYDKNPNKFYIRNITKNSYFWEMLKEKTLKECCDYFNIKYNDSIFYQLKNKKYKERFKLNYKYYKQRNFLIECEIKEYIEQLGFSPSCNNKKIIKPLELDIYIQEKQFSIEFNGSYWHSDANLINLFINNKLTYDQFIEKKTKLQKSHALKTLLCKEKNIYLFHIFEYDWQKNPTKIKEYIKTKLGLNSIKIDARKCSINYEYAGDFIERNHLKGNNNNAHQYINLIYNNEIIASISAARHHRKNNYDIIVLSRFALKNGCNVRGGASKLFKYFKQWALGNNYKKIISWSDNSYSYGDIYKILGFNNVAELSPDYFYWDVKNRKYVSKQSMKKSKCKCPENMTEEQFCQLNGFYRIYDCGKIRWEYVLE